MPRLVLSLAGVAWLLVACGNPRSSQETFEFEPYPYVITPVLSCSDCGEQEISFDRETCSEFIADELLVDIPAGRMDALARAARRWGFEVLRRSDELGFEPRDTEYMLIKVPLGSVPDAERFIEERFDGASAQPNFVFYFDTYPAEVTVCWRNRAQEDAAP